MPMCRRPESETDADEEKACAGLVRVVAVSVSASMVSAAAEDDCRRDGQAIIVSCCPCVSFVVLCVVCRQSRAVEIHSPENQNWNPHLRNPELENSSEETRNLSSNDVAEANHARCARLMT